MRAAGRAVDALRRLLRRLGVGRLMARLGLADALLRIAPFESATVYAGPPPSPSARGVMLVGHPYGVQGVGEYLRSSAAALAAAGVPFHIRNAFDWGEHLRPVNEDFAFWDRLATSNAYRANVLFVNADEMEEVLRRLGRGFFAGRRTIACWHWELSGFPAVWRGALDGVHELWASSRFMRDTLAETAKVPVLWMPHPVAPEPVPPLSRAALGLPEGSYLFLVTFDLNSFLARKNPLAAVRAFQAAFPRGGAADAALVLKVGGSAERPNEARALRDAPELRDPRVVVVDALLERGRMLALMAQCDAYVSLHRAEGFGRGLAEAMLLGKPVIATGYSGNMDFTTPETACLVDYRLVPVGAHEYPHAGGQRWAEPDVEQAAMFMRRLVDDRAWGDALGARGRELVRAQHGPEAVGARLRARLVELGLL